MVRIRVAVNGGPEQLGLLHLFQCAAGVWWKKSKGSQTSKKVQDFKSICIWNVLPGYTTGCNPWDISA